jgi:cytoskeletal protein CcmA (bactofilin family)
VVALVIAPSIALEKITTSPEPIAVEIRMESNSIADDTLAVENQIQVEMKMVDELNVSATVKVTKTVNGEIITEEHIFNGTKAAVQAQIDALKN